ncbi:MAG: glycosyltransferase [Reyranellaceae bacterium]
MSGGGVSFALLCYNQQEFVAEAVAAALTQDCEPIEILISDDASTDGTWEAIQRATAGYRGPHRLRLHRNARNLGCTGHTLAALAMAESDLVVVGAGDDVSEPDRVRAVMQAASQEPQATSFWSDMRLIDEAGRDMGVIPGYFRPQATIPEMTDVGAAPVGASQAYRKIVGEGFAAPDRRAGSEDLVLHYRSALLGGVKRVPGALVRWRRHVGSMESASPLMTSLDAQRFRDSVLRICEQRIFCFRARLDDLAGLAARQPERRAELDDLARRTRRLVRRFEAMQAMQAKAVGGGISAALRALLNGARPGETARNYLAIRHTALWQRYTRWRAAQRRE